MRSAFAILLLGTFLGGRGWADEAPKAPTVLPDPLASLDIGNSAEGSYPGGSTPIKGKWFVEKAAKKLKVETEPLVINWLEFGPEIRERGSTIRALGRSPGTGRLRSRMGIGLYGKNGFQLRIDQGKQVVELVRRGIVLKSTDFETDAETLYEMELSVLEEGEDWRVTVRVWTYETERPMEPLFSIRAYSDELLFPLAGRAFLVATPFSGEPVQYAIARVYAGDPFAPEKEGAEEEID
ncbi:MAG: hypothetical protein AAF491_01005 [Verrucomicrobiota bacterium]